MKNRQFYAHFDQELKEDMRVRIEASSLIDFMLSAQDHLAFQWFIRSLLEEDLKWPSLETINE